MILQQLHVYGPNTASGHLECFLSAGTGPQYAIRRLIMSRKLWNNNTGNTNGTSHGSSGGTSHSLARIPTMKLIGATRPLVADIAVRKPE